MCSIVYVDSAMQCNELAFNLGNAQTTIPTINRSWNIKVSVSTFQA